jgi:hypothetical protein
MESLEHYLLFFWWDLNILNFVDVMNEDFRIKFHVQFVQHIETLNVRKIHRQLRLWNFDHLAGCK